MGDNNRVLVCKKCEQEISSMYEALLEHEHNGPFKTRFIMGDKSENSGGECRKCGSETKLKAVGSDSVFRYVCMDCILEGAKYEE